MNSIDAIDMVLDSAGVLFSPGSATHAYTYNADGTMNTDTATGVDGVTRVMTFGYTAGNLTSMSKWVRTP